jgi:hypothetical protein
MRKRVQCPTCGSLFDQELPNVTAEEADRQRAADDDRGVIFKCPLCEQEIHARRRDLPALPDSA